MMNYKNKNKRLENHLLIYGCDSLTYLVFILWLIGGISSFFVHGIIAKVLCYTPFIMVLIMEYYDLFMCIYYNKRT